MYTRWNIALADPLFFIFLFFLRLLINHWNLPFSSFCMNRWLWNFHSPVSNQWFSSMSFVIKILWYFISEILLIILLINVHLNLFHVFELCVFSSCYWTLITAEKVFARPHFLSYFHLPPLNFQTYFEFKYKGWNPSRDILDWLILFES